MCSSDLPPKKEKREGEVGETRLGWIKGEAGTNQVGGIELKKVRESDEGKQLQINTLLLIVIVFVDHSEVEGCQQTDALLLCPNVLNSPSSAPHH